MSRRSSHETLHSSRMQYALKIVVVALAAGIAVAASHLGPDRRITASRPGRESGKAVVVTSSNTRRSVKRYRRYWNKTPPQGRPLFAAVLEDQHQAIEKNGARDGTRTAASAVTGRRSNQ